MDLIADGLLFLGALTASLYCLVLSRRLRRLTQTEDGMGKVITTLSDQVEDMQAALAAAKLTIDGAGAGLTRQIAQAERVKRGLEEMVERAVEEIAAAQAEIATLRAVTGAVSAVSRDHGREEPKAEPRSLAARPETEANGSVARSEEHAYRSSALYSSTNEPAQGADGAEQSEGRGDDVGPPTARAVRDVVANARRAEAKPASVAGLDMERAVTPAGKALTGRSAVTSPSDRSAQRSPRQDVAQTIGDLIASDRTDDDEAFSRRLIEALSGSDPRAVEPVT